MLKRHRVKLFAMFFVFERIAVILAVIYFRFITKSWVYWINVNIFMQIFVIIAYIWLPESPDFYFAKGRFEESKAILHKIAKVNNVRIKSDQLNF